MKNFLKLIELTKEFDTEIAFSLATSGYNYLETNKVFNTAKFLKDNKDTLIDIIAKSNLNNEILSTIIALQKDITTTSTPTKKSVKKEEKSNKINNKEVKVEKEETVTSVEEPADEQVVGDTALEEEDNSVFAAFQ